MKRFIVFAAFAAIVFAADPIVKHPGELRFPRREFTPPDPARSRHKLSNGATAFLVEDHELPLVNISVLVKTGDYLDPEGKDGLAYMMGREMSSGGTRSKPPSVFEEEAAFLAAQIRTGVSDYQGDASLNCMTKDLDACLALFVDMLRNPGFDESRLKLAKSQTLQGLERRNDSTMSIEQREFARLLRGDKHFSTKPVTKATIDAISRQDLIDLHDRYYYPSNFTLAVSGDFDTKQMLAKIEQALGNWPNMPGKFRSARARFHLSRRSAWSIRKTSIRLACGWGTRV